MSSPFTPPEELPLEEPVVPPAEAADEAPDAPPTKLTRVWWWILRTWGYAAFGLVCVGLAWVVAAAMSRYGMLGYSAQIHVAHHPSLLPFTPFEASWRIRPESFQVILVYALVYWIGVTGSWSSRPRRERTAHPGLVTLMLSPLGGLMVMNAFDREIPWFGVLAMYFIASLPLMAVATAWRFKRAEGRRERVVKWGVVIALLVTTQLHNDRHTPRVGATLSERDAWAREHMGEPYELAVEDLKSAPLLQRLMGGDYRVGPITPENGWLALDYGEVTALRGWFVVDDGERAARCYMSVGESEGERKHFSDVTCYRAGVELVFDMKDPNDYSLDLEITNDGLIKGVEYAPKVFPDLITAFHDVAATSHGLGDVTPTLKYAKVWTDATRIHLKAVSYVTSSSGPLRCRGYVSFDHDGTRRTDLTYGLDEKPRPFPTCAPAEDSKGDEESAD